MDSSLQRVALLHGSIVLPLTVSLSLIDEQIEQRHESAHVRRATISWGNWSSTGVPIISVGVFWYVNGTVHLTGAACGAVRGEFASFQTAARRSRRSYSCTRFHSDLLSEKKPSHLPHRKRKTKLPRSVQLLYSILPVLMYCLPCKRIQYSLYYISFSILYSFLVPDARLNWFQASIYAKRMRQ